MKLDEVLELQRLTKTFEWYDYRPQISEYCRNFFKEILRIDAKYDFKYDTSWTTSHIPMIYEDKLDSAWYDIKNTGFRGKEIFINQHWKRSEKEWKTFDNLETFEIEMLRAYDNGELEEYLVDKHISIYGTQKQQAIKKISEQVEYLKQQWFGMEGKDEFFAKLDNILKLTEEL